MCIYGYHACTMGNEREWRGCSSDRTRVWLIEAVGPLEREPKSQEPLTSKITYTLFSDFNKMTFSQRVGTTYVGGEFVKVAS